MATIMSLSNEVIEIILEYISIKDIENFSSTCKKFRQTTWSNKLWMTKLYQTWPSTRTFFNNLTRKNLERLDFKEETKAIAICINEMWDLISQMPKDNLSDTDKKRSILQLLKKTMNNMIYTVIVNEINRIILQDPWTSDCDLTRRYYSCHIFRQLKYYHTKHKFLQFHKSKNRNQQTLEELVTLLVQWFDVDSNTSYTQIVKPLLDYIALKVLQDLSEKYPSHPIFTISSIFFNYWNNHNVFLTYWEKDDILAILFILDSILFSPTNTMETRANLTGFALPLCICTLAVPLLIDFLKFELNLTEEEQLILQEIIDRDEDEITDLVMWTSNMNIKVSKPERRSAELKFIIGSIVTYTYDGRTHFGVIVGWHNYFNLDSISGIEFNILPYNYLNISCENGENCRNSRCSMHKPYYIIFSNNNEYCYVQQDNISICPTERRIYHDEIGRYFSRYEYTYYVPNEMLAKVYPYDIAIINYLMHHDFVMLS
ncbi:uncharacterized protein [Polyergus mexicanus]|uniref:uncharacterized protein n=1 Tax=Polyergus mexicanus TaxID=615972 RepID=UPI0038B63650